MPALGCQRNALAVAFKQSATEPGFQRLDLLGHGRWRHAQLAGRCDKAAVAGSGLKSAQRRVGRQAQLGWVNGHRV